MHLSRLFAKEERRNKYCAPLPTPFLTHTSLLAKLGLCLRQCYTAEGNESNIQDIQ